MTNRSDWFTASRVRRLQSVLEELHARAPGFAQANATQVLWPACGGPRNEIADLLDVLTRSGLAQLQAKRVYRTRQGERIVQMNADRSRQELAMLLIRRGWLHDQIRQFLTVATRDATTLVCNTKLAREVSPQLVGILQIWPSLVSEVRVVVNGELLVEIDSPWSLIPSVTLAAEDARMTIGKRGEAYSFQFLRHNASRPEDVLWVAADDETLGHDIEDRSSGRLERVEIKASVGTPVRFHLSPNEYRQAHEHGSEYIVHFWGGINLHLDPAKEFKQLRDKGYPRVFPDLAGHLSEGRLIGEPCDWLVTEPIASS